MLKTGLLNVPLPDILKVPFVMERNPAVLAPATVNVPPGVKVRTGTLLVPLFKLTPVVCFKLVVLAAPRVQAASFAPVNVICALEVKRL